MEIKAELINYTEQERTHFIIEQNHKLGYEIKEYTTSEIHEETIINPETEEEETIEVEIETKHLEAWGYTEEEKQAKEKESVKHLSLTKREVFLAIYRDKQITPEQIRELITTEEGKIEFDYANDYFRGNPLIDQLGTALGYTSAELDYLFKNREFPKNEV